MRQHTGKETKEEGEFFYTEQKEKSLCLRGLFDDDEKQIKKFLHNSLVIKRSARSDVVGVNT